MKLLQKQRKFLPLLAIIMIVPVFMFGQNEAKNREKTKDQSNDVNTRVDNNGYWKRKAKEGLATLNPVVKVEKATFRGSEIDAIGVVTEDSPDVPVTSVNSTQSENSIFVNPNDNENALNSNNSTQNPVGSLFGANDFFTFDAGLNWGGEVQGAGGPNSGDPATAIGLNGRYFVGYINSGLGQGISYSDDNGQSWTAKTVKNGGGNTLDKNHLWIDNSPTSLYSGNLYDAWTPFGGSNDSDIELARSVDNGETWSSTINVSQGIASGHCQGVNIQTGPNGEVYVIFSIYDGWPQDEKAIGMAKSTNGGASFAAPTKIINNIRGIRNTETSKNMRVNSFPVMAVDISNGPNRGNIYVVWANVGVPGINSGNDIDSYIIRSEDGGDSWSTPVKINQDPSGLGKEHYFPWITCDPESGALSVVFYDDRNVASNQCEVFAANSFDGGETWEDFKVSDVSFTPSPIPGLAGSYFGDYLGISAFGGMVYPCWTDNRSGTAMTYVSPYQTNNLPRPTDLIADLNEETGTVDLEWQFESVAGFQYFIVYRDGEQLGTTTDLTFSDNLPNYGVFQYKVTAFLDEGESLGPAQSIQWGNPNIAVSQNSFTKILQPDQTGSESLIINNEGELELEYEIAISINSKDSKDYCSASGGCDEYISNVEVGDINNSSDCTEYGDYTDLSTTMNAGDSYPITITNGNSWNGDECMIWVDWNQNEEFDGDEAISPNGGPDVYTANIIPPDDAVGGSTRMRIRLQYYGTPEPCGTTSYGEVEDYTIDVVSWLAVSPTSGNIAAGESETITLDFDATDMEEDTYTADLTLTSNDPDEPVITIPVSLIVQEGAAATQTIELSEGYQFASSSVEPLENDMIVVLQDILNDNLDYVRNSNGEVLRKIGPNWINGIGDWSVTEGYLFKMNATETLVIEGEQLNAQTPINLVTGYQFVSYLPLNAMDAMDAFAEIIGDDLDFIRNSNGEILRKIGPNWVNGIGNVEPGEGYLIKMFNSDILIYPASGKKLAYIEKLIPVHFTFDGGNAADAVWTIYLNEQTESGNYLNIGDEIGIFDGKTLVGSAVINQTLSENNKYQNVLTVFGTLNDSKGYNPDYPFTIKVWNNNKNVEIIDFDFELISADKAFTGVNFPTEDGQYSYGTLDFSDLKIKENILSNTFLGNNYPNPLNNKTTIAYGLGESGKVKLTIFNSFGQQVSIPINQVQSKGTYNINIDCSDFTPGIYQYKLEIEGSVEKFTESKVMVII